MQLQWIIRSLHDFQAFDEFVVGRFRLRLTGTLLAVEAEGPIDDSEFRSAASDLAYRYFAVLKKHVPVLMNLKTFEEFAAIQPPILQITTITGSTAAECKLHRDGVRLARGEMLASNDPYLRRSYDYLERARGDETNRLFHFYKFVETLEDLFGGEAKLIEALDVKTAVKTLKKLANDRRYDERHAPNASGKSNRVSSGNQNRATSCAHEIIRAYEKFLSGCR